MGEKLEAVVGGVYGVADAGRIFHIVKDRFSRVQNVHVVSGEGRGGGKGSQSCEDCEMCLHFSGYVCLAGVNEKMNII